MCACVVFIVPPPSPLLFSRRTVGCAVFLLWDLNGATRTHLKAMGRFDFLFPFAIPEGLGKSMWW